MLTPSRTVATQCQARRAEIGNVRVGVLNSSTCAPATATGRTGPGASTLSVVPKTGGCRGATILFGYFDPGLPTYLFQS